MRDSVVHKNSNSILTYYRVIALVELGHGKSFNEKKCTLFLHVHCGFVIEWWLQHWIFHLGF